MTILDKIIAEKQHEVSVRKQEVSIHQLEKSSTFSRQTISLKKALQQSNTGIIAEFKRKSPSKGWIA